MPNRPRRPCWYPGCPALSDAGACDKHPRRRTENKSEVRRFRSHRRWREYSEARRRAEPICPDPYGIHEARGIPETVTSTHHKTPLSVDLSRGLDDDNTEPLCDCCHAIADQIAQGRDASRMIADAKAMTPALVPL